MEPYDLTFWKSGGIEDFDDAQPLPEAPSLLSRTVLLLKYWEWFDEAKARELVTKFHAVHVPTEKVLPSDTTAYKVIDVLQRMKMINEDEHSFKLLYNMYYAEKKLLFHIHGDEFGANNENLEGHQKIYALHYLLNFLWNANLAEYGLEKSIIDEVNTAYQIACSTTQKDFIDLTKQALNKKRNVLLPGGWTNFPSGHALYYEVIPENDYQVTFRIFNLGAGSEGDIDPDSFKTKAPVYIDFNGVERAKLMNDNVLQAIYEINHLVYFPESTKRTEYGQDDIYAGLRALLGPTSVSHAKTFKTTQRSGVCSWRSLMAFMSSRIKDTNKYKCFACDIKMQSSMHREFKNIIERDELNLLEKSHEKLARKVNKLYSHGIGIAYLLSVVERLSTMRDYIKGRKIALNKSERASDVEVCTENQISVVASLSSMMFYFGWRKPFIHDWDKTEIQKKHKPVPLHIKPLGILPEKQIVQRPLTLHQRIVNLTPSEVIQEVEKLIENREFQAAHIVLQKYILQLDLAKMNQSNPSKLASQLARIAKLYFDTCFLVPEAHIVLPERVKTMEKIQQTHFEAACLINTMLKEFKFHRWCYYSFFFTPNGNEGKNISSGVELHPNYNFNEIIQKSSNYFFSDRESDKQILKELKKLLSETDDCLMVDSKYAAMKPGDQIVSLLLCEKAPNWFKEVRDVSIYLHYLQNEPVANLINPETKSVSVKLTKVSNDNSTTIYISLNEISGDILTYHPELKEERDSWRHFANNHRPFFSESVKNWMHYLCCRRSITEKELIDDNVKNHLNFQFSDEYFKELTHVFTDYNTIHEGFEFFCKYPDKLSDSDYQTLFEIFIFRNECLSNIKPPMFLRFDKFIRDQIDNALIWNEIQKAVFLIRISRQLNKYHSNVKDQSKKLFEMLKQPRLEIAEKSAIYAEIIASLSKKGNLQDPEIEALVVGTAYLKEYPLPHKWDIPQQRNEIREAEIIHFESLVNIFKSDLKVSILNHIVKELCPNDQGHNWVSTPDGFRSADGKFTYQIKNFKMITAEREVSLPLDIIENVHFIQNFKGKTTGVYSQNGIYKFTHKGLETRVREDKGKITIEQRRGGVWYLFLPREVFIKDTKEGVRETSLGSRYLLQNFKHWQPVNNVDIIHLVGDKVSYKAFLNNDSVCMVKTFDELLTLQRPSDLLSRFEDKTYIQEWAREGVRVFIELPRFGLTFRLNQENQQWECDQYRKDGYYIANLQSVDLMGSYKNYLVLVNNKGQKKILVPEYRIESSQKMNSLEPEYDVDKFLLPDQLEEQTYLAFDINKKGLAESNSRSAKTFLASILTTVQEYENAALYLQKCGPKLSRYTKKEIQYLETIANMQSITGDASGNGLALQTFAMKLLLRNSLEHDKEYKANPYIYIDYLAHMSNATALRLTKEEELILLKYFLELNYHPVLFLRLQKLDPDCAANLKKIEKEVEHVKVKSFEKEDFNINFATAFKPLSGSLILTRINAYIQMNPVEMYQRVLQASPNDIDWFKQAFIYGKRMEKSHLSHLFEYILEHPNIYQQHAVPILQKHSKSKLEIWWSKVVESALPNLKRVAPQQEPHKFEFPQKARPQISPILDISANIQVDPQLKNWPDFSKFFKTNLVENLRTKKHAQWLKKESMKREAPPLYQNEISRLQKDQEEQKEEIRYSIVPLASIPINEGRKVNLRRISHLEQQLITLANKPSDDFRMKISELLQVRGKINKVITLDDLMISFAKKDPKYLLRLNPNLETCIDELYKRLGEYLMLKVLEQKRERGLKTLQKLKNAVESDKADYEHQLGIDLLSERAYDPNSRPAFLVFEYYADMWMRKQQVEKLEEFLNGVDKNNVMEMIMGSGKSKVLLPLLGLLRADGIKLSMIIVPQSLFESVSSDTQRILSNTFGQSLKSLHFSRNTKFNMASLERIHNELKEIIEKKECLIITSKSIQCFFLKFIEESYKQEGKITTELKLMREILNIIRASHPIIDEIDTVLNVLHEVCFSTGKPVSPRESDTKLISEIFHILYTDPEIKKLVRIESDPQCRNDAEELTEKNFPKTIIARKILKLSQFAGLNPTFALNYLCRKNIQVTQVLFNALNANQRNALALASEQLNNFLPHTLTKNCDEKYGLDKKNSGNIAIPYAAVNTPTIGSQFANPYITMNYTFQYYIKRGIPRDSIMKEIQRLQNKAMNELKENSLLPLQKTHSWSAFKVLVGDLDLPLFNFNEKHLDYLADKLNQSISDRLLFVQMFILPQLELFEKKMSCNPMNLVDFFSNVSGFTGTLWNHDSMHSKLDPIPDPGIDSKTLNLIWKNSTNAIFHINGMSPKQILEELEKFTYDLVADAGGYLKEGGNSVIAHQMAGVTHKPVVFYNGDNQQAILENEKETLLAEADTAPEKRVTFLDQSHTTGADVPQKRNAIGVVTISRQMLLRDFLQSVWRLRGLDKSQKVKIVISKEVRSIINQMLDHDIEQQITYDDLLVFMINNQTKQQGIDNFKALIHEMSSLPQSLLFKVMLSDHTDVERKKTLDGLKSYWIKETNKEPKDQFGQLAVEELSSKVVEEERLKMQAIIYDLSMKLPFFKDILKEMEAKIDKLAELVKGKLATKIIAPIRDSDDDQTVEIQQETQVQLEEQECGEVLPFQLGQLNDFGGIERVDCMDEKIFKHIKHSEAKHKNIPYFKLGLYFSKVSAFKVFASAFDDIDLTINVFQWPNNSPKVSDLRLFGPHRTPFHRIQFVDQRPLILSSYEHDRTNEIYYLGFGFEDPHKQLSEKQQLSIGKIKFLNGECNYTNDEAHLLKAWIRRNVRDKMKTLFLQHILRGMPDMTTAYNNKSTLQQIFNE